MPFELENHHEKEGEGYFAKENATEKTRFTCGGIHSTEAPAAPEKKELTDLGVTQDGKICHKSSTMSGGCPKKKKERFLDHKPQGIPM